MLPRIEREEQTAPFRVTDKRIQIKRNKQIDRHNKKKGGGGGGARSTPSGDGVERATSDFLREKTLLI